MKKSFLKRPGCLLALSPFVALFLFLQIDSIRWSLPDRLFFQPLDIYRSSNAWWYTQLCMRVPLTRAEADKFLREEVDWSSAGKTGNSSEKAVGFARPVTPDINFCPAEFWPKSFETKTIAFAAPRCNHDWCDGSIGAVYENGYFYYWSDFGREYD